MILRPLAPFLFAIPLHVSAGEPPAAKPAPVPAATTAEAAKSISPELRAAIAKLALPGVKINLDEWCVDVASRVCLRDGLLELIACTKETKEHESIIVIDAKPSHVHTALLLLGTKPGNPAMQEVLDEEQTRFRSIPPSGGPVDVFLVLQDAGGKETQHPISDFIAPANQEDGSGESVEGQGAETQGKFPTHTFLFAGSGLVGEGEGPRTYLCDRSGNVISLATFGDELLCLSGIHDDANGALAWRVDGAKLPALGSKVTLRLRPQLKPRAAADAGDKPPGQ
jgi:hypothetical protein